MSNKIYKIALFLLLSLGIVFKASVALSQDNLPEIKASAVVEDSVVTLGDIFTNLTEKEDLVVGNAPEPGKRLIISARYILKLTRNNNVRWRNSAGIKNVSISRMSTLISYSDLKPKMVDELKNLYQSEQNIELRFYNKNGKIHLPNGYDVDDLTISNIMLDRKSDKFSALVSAPTGQGNSVQHTINGRTLRVSTVPALDRTIRSGEIISAADIKWISVPENQIGRNIIRDKNKLIGMTPRSQIKDGAAIRLSEVNRPVLVKRGSLVNIQFNTARISLSTIGKAIEGGGIGDVIQIKNNVSKKIISAIVSGPNQVQVNAPSNNIVLLNQ